MVVLRRTNNQGNMTSKGRTEEWVYSDLIPLLEYETIGEKRHQ
jgi:hypothetical protein